MDEGKLTKQFEEFNKKLEALIILNCVEKLTGEDRLNLLKYAIGIKNVAKILEKDRSNFKKSIKNGDKRNAKTE